MRKCSSYRSSISVSDQLEILKKTCVALSDLGIPYMITGSIAASMYSEPRMTRDIDFVIELKGTDVSAMVDRFRSEFYVDEKMIKDAIQHESMFNLIHQATMQKLDFVIRKETEYRKVEFDRRRTESFGGIPVQVVSAEDLVLSKLLWSNATDSEFQLRDVKNVLRAQKKLDANYLKKWSETLGVSDLLKKASQE